MLKMGPAHDAAVCGNLEWFRAAFASGGNGNENLNAANDVRPDASPALMCLVCLVCLVCLAAAAGLPSHCIASPTN